MVGDEVLTPDSSRFWPADSYAPGSSPPSFDKQYVRNWLETQDWDKTPPGPELPDEVRDGTAARYREAYERLAGTPVGELSRGDGGARVKVTVLVRPKEGILDPQGEAIRQALTTLGYPASSVRAGRVFDVELDVEDAAEAERIGREAADRVLANGLIEGYEVVVEGYEAAARWPSEQAASRIGVISFPAPATTATRCARSSSRAARPCALWHADADLDGCSGVIVPGGFSYGDYLRAGAIARFAPMMREVEAFAAAGGPVLGICNGFQVLCEAGLLPGVLRPEPPRALRLPRRRSRRPARRLAVARAASSRAPCCACRSSTTTAPGTRRPRSYERVEAAGQIALRYAENPNGALADVACVTNEAGNVCGLMPHPEHAMDALLGPVGGRPLLEGLVALATAHRKAGPVSA